MRLLSQGSEAQYESSRENTVLNPSVSLDVHQICTMGPGYCMSQSLRLAETNLLKIPSVLDSLSSALKLPSLRGLSESKLCIFWKQCKTFFPLSRLSAGGVMFWGINEEFVLFHIILFE